MWYHRIFYLSVFLSVICSTLCDESLDEIYKKPTVAVTILVRNKYHTLPYFLSCLYNQDYPKDRMYIWIHSDFNSDNSDEILETWVDNHSTEYNGISLTTNKTSGPLHPDESKSCHWSPMHFNHVINLRQSALQHAREIWADFVFMLDADAFLTDPKTLETLVDKDLPVVAPMLLSDGLYSNFWCGMNEDLYYKRTDEYGPIQSREKQGCHRVVMVHSALLVSLRRRSGERLSYRAAPRYTGPQDDIIVFAVNAMDNGVPLHVCNDRLYGFIPIPLDDGDDPALDAEQLLNVKLEAIARHSPLPLLPELAGYVTHPPRWSYGVDEVYLINLERRPDRRDLMERSFTELGMLAKYVKAVDGKLLNIAQLEQEGVRLMPGYEDPYHKRPMKIGEVGCFLSHYNIWKEMLELGHESALVLEDDVHFVPFFRRRYFALMEELKNLDWDLLYLGRKILLDGSEEMVTSLASRPLYSYWTLGYVIRESGARKLLAAEPLRQLLPVDEFLPIMFDQHPNTTWKERFPVRDLVALSAAPLLLHPTHYTGQPGYISDTEDSQQLADDDTDNTENQPKIDPQTQTIPLPKLNAIPHAYAPSNTRSEL